MLYSRVRSEYSLQVQPIAMTRSRPHTRLPTVAAVMTLRGRVTVQLSSSVPSLQSTWPSQRQLSNTHLSLSQWKVPGLQMVQSLSSLPSAQYSW